MYKLRDVWIQQIAFSPLVQRDEGITKLFLVIPNQGIKDAVNMKLLDIYICIYLYSFQAMQNL